MRPLQRQVGGAFGTLVLLIAIGVAGYYAYRYLMEAEEAPSCKARLNRCVATCRRTNTEAPPLQACQEGCQREAQACEQSGK